jgi:hypothetical protein
MFQHCARSKAVVAALFGSKVTIKTLSIYHNCALLQQIFHAAN